MKNNPKTRARRKKKEMPKGYIIEVTRKEYYMFDFPPNGQPVEEIIEQWFQLYPLGRWHESRDRAKLGNMQVVLDVRAVTEEEMVKEVDGYLMDKLKTRYRKFSDLFEEYPLAKEIDWIKDIDPYQIHDAMLYEDEVYIPITRYEAYVENVRLMSEFIERFQKPKKKGGEKNVKTK